MPERNQTISTPADVVVRIDGKEIRENILEFNLAQFVDRHHELTVVVTDVGARSAENDFSDPTEFSSKLGKSISVDINLSGGLEGIAGELKFIGVITGIDMVNAVGEINTIAIRASSPTIAMDGVRKNTFHIDKSVKDIIDSTVSGYEVTVGKIDGADPQLSYCAQYRESDYDFVMRLASSIGLFAFYDGEKFEVGKPDAGEPVDLSWREALGSFSLELGTQPLNYGTASYDYAADKTYENESGSKPSGKSLSGILAESPKASEKLYAKPSFVGFHPRVSSARDVDNVLKVQRDAAIGRLISGRGTSIHPGIRVGRSVKINGMDTYNGQYYVTSVRHTTGDNGQYTNEFTCIPMDIAHPQYHSKRYRTTDIQRAVVTDNDDPEKLGRVKVKFPWLEADSNWVRQATLHAGEERGFFFLPEVGDEVLVAFEQGNPDHPVIIGALYNKTGVPPGDGTRAINDVKVLMTKGGNKIMITDKSGSEEIAISTKDGKNQVVLAQSGPSITIKSDGDVTISGSNITIDASQDVKIKGGANVKAESSANFDIKAGANLKTEASAMYDAKGAMVKIKGNLINLN